MRNARLVRRVDCQLHARSLNECKTLSAIRLLQTLRRRPGQLAPLLHEAQLQHLGLYRDVGRIGLRAR